MIDTLPILATSDTLGGRSEDSATLTPYKAISDTASVSTTSVVLVQGRHVVDGQDGGKLVVTFAPASVARKLSIRDLNNQASGYSFVTNTFSGKKFFP